MSLLFIILSWSNFLENAKSSYLARDLYRGGGFKKLSKNILNEEFLIISAGLGLVSSDTRIPSYECTVSRSKANSISDYFKDEFSYHMWWKYLVYSKLLKMMRMKSMTLKNEITIM